MLSFFKLFFSSLVLCVLSACGDDQKSSTLIIGTSGDNPPFEFYQNGKLVGFDIDLGRLLAQKLGREVQFMDMPFDSLVAALQSKKVDCVLAAMTSTEARKRAVDFTRPYYKASAILVTPGLTDVKAIEDLSGQLVAVQLGSTFETYAQTVLSKRVNVTLRSLNKVTDMIQELRTQRVAGLITGVAEASKILESNPSFKVIPLPPVEGAGEAIALPKGSSLTKALDDIINMLEAEGGLERLKATWNMD